MYDFYSFPLPRFVLLTDLTQGYYFASSQEHSHLSVAKKVGSLMKKHGMCQNADPVELDLQTVDGLVEHPGFSHVGTYMFAANSRSRADRAKERFGYEPTAPGLMESLEEDLLACAK
jgi:hypothetical protein